MPSKLCFLATLLFVYLTISLSTLSSGQAQESDTSQPKTWKHVSSTPFSKPLDNIIDVIGTKDGKFVYTASFQKGALGIFERNQETGKLTLKSVFTEKVRGLGDLSMSDDETLLVGTCYKRKLVLFQRDTKTGEVTLLDQLSNGAEVQNNLKHALSIKMSGDGKFIYAPNWIGAMAVYAVRENKLSFLHHHEGIDGCLKGAKLMATDSTGNMIFLACEISGVVAVFDRDPDGGHLRFLSFVKDGDENGEISKLAGAHSIAVSPDDKFIYVLGGRTQGITAINTFSVDKKSGKIKLVQAWTPEGKPFQAGNHISISPDGKYLVASGAASKTLANFSIDADSGKITFKEFLTVGDISEIGMVSGLYFTEDGEFLYAGDEVNGRVYCFQRSEE